MGEDIDILPHFGIESIKFVRTYFVRGIAPKDWVFKPEIEEPPAGGFGLVLLIKDISNDFRIFSPFTLQTWSVSKRALEVIAAEEAESPTKAIKYILKNWAYPHTAPDHETATDILRFLKVENIPERPININTDKKSNRSKGKLPEVSRFLPIRHNSKRAKILKAFIGKEFKNLKAMERRFGLTRSGILSHLFCIHKFHGIGYELGRDCARLLIPEGIKETSLVE